MAGLYMVFSCEMTSTNSILLFNGKEKTMRYLHIIKIFSILEHKEILIGSNKIDKHNLI